MNEKNLSEKELLEMPKEDLVGMIMGMQSSFNEMKRTIDLLSETVSVMNPRAFGRKSEAVSPLQLELELGLNEAEALADPEEKEPTLEEAAPRKKRPVGKRKADLEKITEHKTIPVEIPEEELDSRFGKGNWKRLPSQIITKLEHIPASFVAVTYEIGVYAANDNQTIIRAAKPDELWQNSIATASLVAAIMFSKYINAVPLYRQEKAYADNNVNISRATMANWMIAAAEKYLKYYYEVMHKKLIEQKYLHADETKVEVSKDGRETGAQSFMWVYRTQKKEGVPQIVLYDYQKTRSSEHPENFLKGFKGTLSTDGYDVYHKLERTDPVSFKVCGCWVHAKRKYSELVKADGKKSKGTLADKGIKMISKIFYENKKLDDLTAILLRNGIHLKDCRGNSSVQKQTEKHSSGLMRKIIESSGNQDLILTKNDPKKVQEAIKAYASHLHLGDVIAFLDTTKKSFFKTTPGGILFTEKAIESSGRHIEYEKISDVEVIENKLVFRYGTGIKISLDCDDKKKTVRNLIAEYQKQKQ